MPLPTSGAIPFVIGNEAQAGSSSSSKTAFLIKFPEEIWDSLQNGAAGSGSGSVSGKMSPNGSASGSGMRVSVAADGRMTLNIPNLPPIPLDSRSTGTSSEIHTYNPSNPSLSLSATASTRLSIPLSSASTARAADKLKAQNEAIERERKERAIRVEGSAPPSKSRPSGVPASLSAASASMGRTHSSPQITASTSASASGGAHVGTSSGAGQPMIPLKTRVMQLLALGPTTVSDIVRRVGGDEQNVMRVVNVVGRAFSTHPPTYTLLPNQYSKIKIGPGQWKYTYAEQQQVIRLAREAFDELGLEADAEERIELDRKEQEALNGYHSAASSSTSGSQAQPQAHADKTSSSGANVGSTLPVPPHTNVHTSSKPNSKGKRTESPAPTPSTSIAAASTSVTTKKSTTAKSKNAGPQSKIARERAKFMAERGRATSAPNARAADGAASPRTAPTPVQASDTEDNKPIKKTQKAKDKGKERPKEHKEPKTAENAENGRRRGSKSRDYSSDEEDEDEPEHGRGKGRLTNANPARNGDDASAPAKTIKTKPDGNAPEKERPSLRDKVRERDKAKIEQQERERERERERGSSKRRHIESSEEGEEEEEEEEGAIREHKVVSNRENGDGEEGEIRGRPKTKVNRDHQSPTHKRKPPPPELKLNGATPPSSTLASATGSTANGSSSKALATTIPHPASAPLPRTSGRDRYGDGDRDIEPDPESLRERYEELFPAYQQLTKKLAKVHQSAESEAGLQGVSEEEVGKLVKRWEKWHNELAEIRRWFGDA
ncbi:hypothetical protein I316_00640 [Kwoniella heveanensis BCC8398]|uniref:RNA polymerase II elongation factor ELL N-terminal domain-containing protein n=1 Tax=Kwoniella heveanensis BCC8398 TaxID=1296120 RepID=A0A1B9H2L6_9TREE|nr:hypothetical protein I316_00640 [Kwoniella heveanensis BCC8398]